MTDVTQPPETPHSAAAVTAALVGVAGAMGLPERLGLDADGMTVLLGAIMSCIATVFAVLSRRAKE